MKAYLGRRYRFSASHRLHVDGFSDERNREVFGKCNNPFGHGHNYWLEVVLSGTVDPTTGMLCNLVEIDEFAHQRLIAKFDHQNLNTLPEFDALVPSTENLAIVIWEILKGFTAAKVEKIRIEETPNNSFEYSGE
ncbi:6-carboxytetrahydropterin synthase [Terriglobus albidus]|uniref:6-carboxytetrahydropterin synthase n=1 Tax=Terriglobus albidus TaxID=1592106 RepID=UPI0021DFEE62|nr:6-carboxytetrahydropterin synthase [Terriglobus albidus]